MMKNIDIRLMISDAGLMHKDIAEQIGIRPTSFSRLLRSPLSQKDRLRIIKAIETLKEQEA